MFTHEQIWQAIEALAQSQRWSLSRLAVRAGLDPTALNRSKRTGFDGKPRWPSTSTVSKLLLATGTSLTDFCRAMESQHGAAAPIGTSVLLADEDRAFLESGASALRQAGYRVRLAADHRAALDVLEDGGIDVLCSELAMVNSLGGLALARIARQRSPGIKILFVSRVDIPGIDARAGAPVLHKPLALTELVAAIGRLLADPSGAPVSPPRTVRHPLPAANNLP
jgi:CheY-like chemotaxis protein